MRHVEKRGREMCIVTEMGLYEEESHSAKMKIANTKKIVPAVFRKARPD